MEHFYFFAITTLIFTMFTKIYEQSLNNIMLRMSKTITQPTQKMYFLRFSISIYLRFLGYK